MAGLESAQVFKPQAAGQGLVTNKIIPDATAKSTLDIFLDNVRESVTKHAWEKGYLANTSNIDAPNPALQLTQILGIDRQHAMAEIVYKANEYLHHPDKLVLLEKIAGWAYIAWRSEQEKVK